MRQLREKPKNVEEIAVFSIELLSKHKNWMRTTGKNKHIRNNIRLPTKNLSNDRRRKLISKNIEYQNYFWRNEPQFEQFKQTMKSHSTFSKSIIWKSNEHDDGMRRRENCDFKIESEFFCPKYVMVGQLSDFHNKISLFRSVSLDQQQKKYKKGNKQFMILEKGVASTLGDFIVGNYKANKNEVENVFQSSQKKKKKEFKYKRAAVNEIENDFISLTAEAISLPTINRHLGKEIKKGKSKKNNKKKNKRDEAFIGCFPEITFKTKKKKKT
ncbi:hypothetical protein JTB14_013598 [Gonioctena quinquepunctata]|nr:hypothetical protein JTB14_013598 [Gonioctena quinquepunctata]